MTFSFRTSMNIRCGKGIVATLGTEVQDLGFATVIFVTDPGLRTAGVSDKALESLSQAGIEFTVFDGVEPNPKDVTIESAWHSLKSAIPDAVIGFGGGSAIDAAKAMAVLAHNPGHLRDYDGAGKIGNQALPVIAVPTTAGTGSEVTPNAAITDVKRKYKMSLRSPSLIPVLALLDPTLLATLPRRIAAESSMDAIIHAAESLVSNKANLVSEALSVQALGHLCPNIRPFIAARNNTPTAERMLVGSMLAGAVIGNTGTGADHALARALGGMYNLSHGLACSLMFPYVVRFNFIANPEKYRVFASKLGLDASHKNDSLLCDMLVDELFRLCADLGIPTRLSDVGLNEIAIDELAEIAQKNCGPNPRETTVRDLAGLLEQAF